MSSFSRAAAGEMADGLAWSLPRECLFERRRSGQPDEELSGERGDMPSDVALGSRQLNSATTMTRKHTNNKNIVPLLSGACTAHATMSWSEASDVLYVSSWTV